MATLADLPFLDSLQKKHSKALGFMKTKQFEGYIAMGAVLIAESVASCQLPVASGEPPSSLATDNSQLATPLGYVIWRDRYKHRDELGVIFQLCVADGEQRKFVGAALVREVFARSAYGCRLYCLWCAQDLAANHFWESLGFVPVAFRAGSDKKKRVHIFWQKRIVEGDVVTPYWYPCQTSGGAIRQDRLVFPIPAGTHWKDVQAVVLPEQPKLEAPEAAKKVVREPKVKAVARRPALTPLGGFRFQSEVVPAAVPVKDAKRKAPKAPAAKIDPKYRVAARELRDRWLEHVNTGLAELPAAAGKYDVSRALPHAPKPTPLLPAA